MVVLRLLASRRLMVQAPFRHNMRHILLNARAFASSSNSNEVPFYGLPRPPPPNETNNSTSTAVLPKVLLAIQSAKTALQDPTRADAVAALGEVTGHVALTNMYDAMMTNATGQLILKDKPLVSKATLDIYDLQQQANQHDNDQDHDDTKAMTFGMAYGRFLNTHGFDPDERDQVQYIDNSELVYVMLRYRQCHDYWHVLTGLPPTVLGELGLKWLELLQTGLPVAALSATVGALALENDKRHVLMEHYLPWAIQMNKQMSTNLLNVYYEEEFDTDLNELRRRLCIEPAPSVGNKGE